jgi:hypothetical protein
VCVCVCVCLSVFAVLDALRNVIIEYPFSEISISFF